MDKDVPEFQQLDKSLAYELRSGTGAAWVGYVLPSGSTSPPATISLSSAFSNYYGHYVFALERPTLLETNPGLFAIEIQKHVSSHGVAADSYGAAAGPLDPRGVIWLPDPNSMTFGPPERYAFFFSYAFGGNRVLLPSMLVPIAGDLALNVGAATGVGVNGNDGSLLLSNTSTSGAAFGFSPVFSGLSVGTSVARLSLLGDRAGAFLIPAQMDLTAKSPPIKSAAFRYWRPAREAGEAPRASSPNESVMQVYPATDAGGVWPARAALACSVHPLDISNAAGGSISPSAGVLRTQFVFTDTTPSALPSFFRTTTGAAIALTPLGGAGGDGSPRPFAGGFAPDAQQDPAAAAVGMTLSGDWGLSPQPGTHQARLLCGLFGGEFLAFSSYVAAKGQEGNDRLRFFPAAAAFAPRYPFDKASFLNPAASAPGPLLETKPWAQTAWAALVAGEGATVQYSAEPGGAALYGRDPTDAAEAALPTILPSQPPFSEAPQTSGFSFPLAPYSGISSESARSADIAGFESQIISATRKQSFAEHNTRRRLLSRRSRRKAFASDEWRLTTPQGLLAYAQKEGGQQNFTKIVLAQSTYAQPFAFVSPSPQLQEAFLTNQLFLVIVNAKHINDSSNGASFENVLEIAGWRFVANIGAGVTAATYSNVMILKFCDGSLRQRVGNPNRWTNPADFSLAPDTVKGAEDIAYAGLSQWLQDYVKAGVDEWKTNKNPLYKDFATLVEDVSWNGVITLAAEIASADLPAQIEGLAPGIDFTNFKAHHFGSAVSRVTIQKDGQPGVDGVSSLFGLIDYEDPTYRANVASGADPDSPMPLPTANGLAFRVLKLQARFANAAMVDFASRIQLTVDAFFGSRVLGVEDRRGQVVAKNGLLLEGSAVRQNDQTVYVFQQKAPTTLRLDSNVLQALTVTRVQFNTLTADGAATVQTRFLVWGTIDFVPLRTDSGAPFDVLSFGAEDGPDGAGLAFSNLQILMQFPASTPTAVSFSLDAGTLSLDLAASTPRAQSLFRGFGLQLQSFIEAEPGKRPSDYGFLPVTTKGAAIQPIADAWRGVVYKVTMGTPGALVSSAGFESKLLVAWSSNTKATDTQPALFIGLGLPGAAPGASLFSLQGIFHVAVDQIALSYQPVPGKHRADDSPQRYWNLRLGNIGVKVFGVAKLPPNGSISFFLFGRPEHGGAVGWYTAYVADDADSEPTRLASEQPLLSHRSRS